MSEEVKHDVKSVLSKEEMEKKAPEKKPLTQEQMRRLQKEAAMELASYKKRLHESVELKRLQVEELKLNIEYYRVKKEHDMVNHLIEEEEAKARAEAQKAIEESKKKADLRVVKGGAPRTEAEIEEAKEIVTK